jgi:hypothetical protein
MTFDEVLQALANGADSVAKIRALTGGHDDFPVDEAVRVTLAQRDARIAELQAQIAAGGGTLTPVPEATPPPAPSTSPTPPPAPFPLGDRFDLVSFTDFTDRMPAGWYAYSHSKATKAWDGAIRRRWGSTGESLVVTATGDTSGAVGQNEKQTRGLGLPALHPVVARTGDGERQSYLVILERVRPC